MEFTSHPYGLQANPAWFAKAYGGDYGREKSRTADGEGEIGTRRSKDGEGEIGTRRSKDGEGEIGTRRSKDGEGEIGT